MKTKLFSFINTFDNLPKILLTMLIFKYYQIHRNLNKRISINIKSSLKGLINQDVLHWPKLKAFHNHNNVSSVKTWHKNQYEDLTLLQYGYEWGHGQSMTHILILSIYRFYSKLQYCNKTISIKDPTLNRKPLPGDSSSL